jgi:hypothetical protein
MPALVDFLERVFRDGQAILRTRRLPAPSDDMGARRLLESAYGSYTMSVGGPELPFDADTALAAAECLCQACWFLLVRDEPDEEMEQRVVLAGRPRTPANHLSADLVLRYMPALYHRAKALAPDDRLPARLAEILRQWPLSGVLADLPEGPGQPIDLGGHRGLMLLYAERLAEHEKPSWTPTGEAMECVELVYHHLGKGLAGLRTAKVQPMEPGDE